MKRLILAVSLVCCCVAPVAALADAPVATLDAGSAAPVVTPDAGAIAPTPAPPLPTTFPDPHADPAGFINTTLAFAKTSWAIFIGLAVFGLLELLVWLFASVPFFAALDKGRTTLALGGAAAVLSAALHAWLGSGSTQAALLAALVAGAAIWHPAMASAVADAKKKQSGLATRGLVVFIAIFGIIIAVSASCSLFKSAATDASTCAKTEAGFSVSTLIGYAVDAGTAVIAAAEGNAAPLTALIVKWGEPLCACIANDIATAHPPTASASLGSAAPPSIGDAARQAIAAHHWEGYK